MTTRMDSKPTTEITTGSQDAEGGNKDDVGQRSCQRAGDIDVNGRLMSHADNGDAVTMIAMMPRSIGLAPEPGHDNR